MINTAETLKGQLFVGLRNIANLPIAKAIKSKMDAAINYLDNLASRLTAAVKKVFKQADGQIDDVADEAAESLAKQTDEIDPPGTVCVIGRSSRIGASTRACNGKAPVGKEVEKTPHWRLQEKEHANSYGGTEQVRLETDLGVRIIDSLVENGDIAQEVKTGYMSLSKSIKNQIDKDFLLLATKQVKEIEWHFYTSSVSGTRGPSGPLKKVLEAIEFKVIKH